MTTPARPNDQTIRTLFVDGQKLYQYLRGVATQVAFMRTMSLRFEQRYTLFWNVVNSVFPWKEHPGTFEVDMASPSRVRRIAGDLADRMYVDAFLQATRGPRVFKRWIESQAKIKSVAQQAVQGILNDTRRNNDAITQSMRTHLMAVRTTKFAADVAMDAYGTWGGPVGALMSLGYTFATSSIEEAAKADCIALAVAQTAGTVGESALLKTIRLGTLTGIDKLVAKHNKPLAAGIAKQQQKLRSLEGMIKKAVNQKINHPHKPTLQRRASNKIAGARAHELNSHRAVNRAKSIQGRNNRLGDAGKGAANKLMFLWLLAQRCQSLAEDLSTY